MSITSEFVTLILSKLHDELSEDQIESVKSALIDCCNDYEIARKNTSIVPSEGFVPEWYGIFIARKKVVGRAVNTLRLYNYYIMDFFLNMPVGSHITATNIRCTLYHAGGSVARMWTNGSGNILKIDNLTEDHVYGLSYTYITA